MTLAHLTIRHEKHQKNNFSETIEALFNPSQLAYSKSVTWSPIHGLTNSRHGFHLEYQSSAPETLTIELFFDTYAMGLASGLVNVRWYTEAVANLARIDTQLRRPPICKLQWGKNSVFTGVLQQSTQTLQMFLTDGTPVRATMNCTFMEYPEETSEPMVALQPLAAIPRAAVRLGSTLSETAAALVLWKQYVVRPGDTLMGIAGALYGDTSQWRRIAQANRIDNPRAITPGQTLSIPRLT